MISTPIDTPPIDIHSIDEGLDRKLLTRLKQRFSQLNEQRLARALASLSERQQQLLQLLPLLFHVNHPMLPGYVSAATPAQLYGYEPDKASLRLAKILARSFTYSRDISDKTPGIDALFVMGSVGSIAHSDSSDLDIWVCHNPALGAAALGELERKCEQISHWAAQHVHLEVHFFLMTGEGFQTGRAARLSSEASGSAQHYLLLDEFYRTALWLGGKLPLWWFVPVTQEHNYLEYTSTLLHKCFIKAGEVIDFGGLPAIPANEYVGAGIWQLYKAIDSPYKSVLKLLLLEVYASGLEGDEARAEPLALSFKRAIYAAEPDADGLDPYVMVYRRIEAYLQARDQGERLELVRRCFYFKANKPLSRTSASAQQSWQRRLLASLVGEWQWNPRLLTMLDNRSYWKSPHVIAERALLVNELNHSYRLLSDLNKQLGLQAAISTDELLILGRKLHAAFERKAGKVEWINPGISRDLSEPALCLVQGEGDQGWQLLRGSQQDLNLRSVAVEPIRRARSLVELLLWCQVNGLLQAGTRVDLLSRHYQLSSVQKNQLLQCLQQWLPAPLVPSHQAFTTNSQVERLLLLVNLGVEPQAELHKKGMQMLSSHSDPLGFSGLRDNLVLSVDLVQLNSWGELVVRHFPQDALVNALLHYLRLLPPGRNGSLPELSIRCFSQGQGSNIAQRLSELWRDLIACYYSGARPPGSRYLLHMGDEYLLLQFLQRQPQIYRFKQLDKLLEKLAQPQLEFSPLVVDRYALRDHPLAVISQCVKSPGIYVFFQLDAEQRQAQVMVVDDKGSFIPLHSQYHSAHTFLKPLLVFIRNSVQHQQWQGELGSAALLDQLQVFELESAKYLSPPGLRGAALQARPLPLQWPQAPLLTIKAIAEMDTGGDLSYSIFCDEREFSALAYGDELFVAVARYILQRRNSAEGYPCYITDLDLSLCRDSIAQQTGLQLSHYLRIKTELETRLNQAMAQAIRER